jgi:hypothetical protein
MSVTKKLRTYLVLARASNLPTVWSNCLAGWLISGGGNWMKFTVLCLAATLLYTGGMFLNDAFDSDFDRHFRPERPIASGAITVEEVWRSGAIFLAAGTLFLLWMNWPTAILAIALVGCILLYDAVHKVFVLAPVIMALCRMLLLLLGATAAQAPHRPFEGLALWSSLALASYVVGLSYLARKESRRGPLGYWPICFLVAPLILTYFVTDLMRDRMALALSSLLIAWIVLCLRNTFWSSHRHVGRTVSGLLAGIVVVDFLSVSNQAQQYGLVFAGLFIAARLFQRYIPAT